MRISTLVQLALLLWIVSGAAAVAVAADPLATGGATGQGRGRPAMVDEYFLPTAGVPAVRGFKAYGGDWQVADGVLRAGADEGPKLVCDEPPLTNGEVGVEMFLPGRRAGNAGLIVKVSEPGVGADRFTGYEVSLDAAAQALRLGRHRQNFELVRDVPCPVPVDRWFPLSVRMTETTMEIVVDGKMALSYEDQEHPLNSGRVGFRPWQREARYRNFWMQTGGRTTTIPLEAPDSAEQNVCPGWRAVCRGTARAEFAVEPPGGDRPGRTQCVRFIAGEGEVGIAGLAGSGTDAGGLAWVAGRRCQGVVWVQCKQATDVFVAAEDAENRVLAETKLAVAPGPWRELHFTLTPDNDAAAGRLAIKLKSPGGMRLGRVLLEPDDWGWPETLAVNDLPPIAVVTRHPLSPPPAVGQDLWAAQPRAPGCSIRIVDPAHAELPAKTIFADPDGCIYDMNVSYDARTLFFSYRRKDERNWHIWRIATDGTNLVQLTDGPYYDVSPCLLPDGDLVFVSTRRFGYTVCQPGPASNLYRMSPDGSNLRCVSMNTLSDFSPQMLPDGRVLFTRWEYIDRDLTYRQSLWTQNPDGTIYQLYFGNTIRDVGTFWQARPLPGHNDRLVATFAPHHGFPHGAIGLIDRSLGPEAPKGAGYVYITQEFPVIGDARHEWAYRDPFPLTEQTFLCSYGGGGVERYRIYLLDAEDRKRLVYEDPAMGCYFPLPLRPAPVPAAIPSRVESPPSPPASTAENPTGAVLLADVYRGLAPKIRRGQVKYVRVMEQIRKTEDLVSRAYDQSPVMSYGTYYAKRCWGTTPVEEDGSAHFLAPALREIYFQVLDAEGRELQRMTSGVQLMPGERITCIGCHEPRQSSPPSLLQLPLAALRPPRELQKPAWGDDGIVDFPTVVQPVLDQYCVKCHAGADPGGGYDLSGDKTRYFNMAYDNLLGRSRSYRQHNMDTGEMLPEEQAKGKPLVHFYWLLRTPTAINRPLWTGCFASRLLDYIDPIASPPGAAHGDPDRGDPNHDDLNIPLEDRQRIYLWIDANVPYYGTYAHSRPLSPGRRDLCTDVATGGLSAWFAEDFLGVYARRCMACHGKYEGTIDWEGRFAWINFTHPELSPALTAHLTKAAGGRGIDRPVDGKTSLIFTSTDDPDYRTMLQAIQTGRQKSLETPEADMPGFQGARAEP